MDVPVLCQRQALIAVRSGAEKRADFVEEAAEVRSSPKCFEPTCHQVALLDSPMILRQMIIQVAVRPVCYPLPSMAR